jgi:hypothetical protein
VSAVRVPVSVLRARDAWFYGAMAFLGVLATALAIASVIDPMVALVSFTSTFGVLGFVVWGFPLYAWSRWRKLVPDPVARFAEAVRDGLRVLGKLTIPRSLIRAAYVSRSWPRGAYVRIERALLPSIELWSEDVESAHALVRALALDAQKVSANIAGASPATRRVFVFAQLAAILGSIACALAWRAPILLSLGCLLCVIASGVPARFVVGTDGVLVRWFGLRRGFVPIESIREVEQKPGVVRLQLHDGSARDLPVARIVEAAADPVGLRVGMLAERIRDAMRRAGTLTVDTSALEAGGADLPGFLQSLRGLSKGAGYRAALQREDLVYVLGDARQPPRIRVAAAVALGELGVEEKARLRIAADSSSIPEVRDALEAVLESDDEELLECMRTL